MRERHNGFTLIELVVVIVILGVLAAVMMPRFIDVSANTGSVRVKSVAGAISTSASIQFAASHMPSGTSYSATDACAGSYLDADMATTAASAQTGMKSGAGLPVNCSTVSSGTGSATCAVTCDGVTTTITLPVTATGSA